MGERRSMSSEYIKQLEDDNWKLRNKLEQFESHCEWLEMLRLLRVTSTWGAVSGHRIRINNYKSEDIGAFDSLNINISKDKTISSAMEYVYDEIIRNGIVSINDANKYQIRHQYDKWRASIVSFVSCAKMIFDTEEYKSIDKMSISTHIHLSLIRLSAESQDIESFDDPLNDKSIFQGVTVVVRKTDKLPSVKIILSKKIDGFKNNVKFMNFDKQVRALTGIFEAVEKLRLAEIELQKERDEY
jgi:hypothetical protein